MELDNKKIALVLSIITLPVYAMIPTKELSITNVSQMDDESFIQHETSSKKLSGLLIREENSIILKTSPKNKRYPLQQEDIKETLLSFIDISSDQYVSITGTINKKPVEISLNNMIESSFQIDIPVLPLNIIDSASLQSIEIYSDKSIYALTYNNKEYSIRLNEESTIKLNRVLIDNLIKQVILTTTFNCSQQKNNTAELATIAFKILQINGKKLNSSIPIGQALSE